MAKLSTSIWPNSFWIKVSMDETSLVHNNGFLRLAEFLLQIKYKNVK